MQFSPTLAERYWRYVPDRPANDCWIWTGAVAPRMGHGILYVGKKDDGRKAVWNAHRVGWLLTYAEDPAELDVLHTCDVPPCQSPGHWFVGTQADNVADMMAKGRNFQPGHPGMAHPLRKIDTTAVKAIRASYAAGGVLQKDLARIYGLSTQQISKIVRGDRWAVVKGD